MKNLSGLSIAYAAHREVLSDLAACKGVAMRGADWDALFFEGKLDSLLQAFKYHMMNSMYNAICESFI